MRRYVCPYHRGACRCGRTSPDRSAAQHAAAGAFIAVLFALGGIGALIRYSVHHPAGWIWLVVIILAVLWMAAIRNRPARRR